MFNNYSIPEMLNLKDKNIKFFNDDFEKTIVKNEETFIYKAYLDSINFRKIAGFKNFVSHKTIVEFILGLDDCLKILMTDIKIFFEQ